MPNLRVTGHYYQQFDADLARDVPGEGYGGWQQAPVELSREHTAAVIMHAWDAGTAEQFPGWHRAVEYIPRAEEICRTVFPRLLGTVRRSGFRLFHVVGGGGYYRGCPGFRKAVDLAGPASAPSLPQVDADPALTALRQFRADHVFVGQRNREDVTRGFARVDFHPSARPEPQEGVAENGHQLFALCRHYGVNHLIYAGFAINWCLLLSPGGMAEMSKYGVMCSALRQAVTAVENRASARQESHKEEGLWRTALAFGFVFDVDDVLAALEGDEA